MDDGKNVVSIRWDGNRLFFLDQTKLPKAAVMEEQTSVEQVWDSIKRLKVRGAPAIGVAGAYGLVLAMREKTELSGLSFIRKLQEYAEYLNGSRPTAVNLSWALNRVVKRVEECKDPDGKKLFAELKREAEDIHREDVALCRSIGEQGLFLIKKNMGILTHCNAGRLATSEYGTATAPLYLAHEKGIPFRVYSDESRPLLQGSRLTAWELMEAGIDVTTVTDNMAAFVMAEGLIDLIIVGTDRVAANGDMANKIGTLGVAILADYFNIPFYVACPASTVDLATTKGSEIIIEERPEEEVTVIANHRVAPEGVKVRNPAFDVTPHRLIRGYITDRGMIYPPYEKNLKKNFE